jgi:hypothetical protein
VTVIRYRIPCLHGYGCQPYTQNPDRQYSEPCGANHSPTCGCLLGGCPLACGCLRLHDVVVSCQTVDGKNTSTCKHRRYLLTVTATPPQAPRHKASRLFCHGRVKRPSISLFSMWALALLLLHHGALFHRVLSRILESYQEYPSLIDIPIPQRNWLMTPHLSCSNSPSQVRTYSSTCFLFFVQGLTCTLGSHESTYATSAEKLSCVRMREGSRTFSSSEMVRFLARRQTFPTGP